MMHAIEYGEEVVTCPWYLGKLINHILFIYHSELFLHSYSVV